MEKNKQNGSTPTQPNQEQTISEKKINYTKIQTVLCKVSAWICMILGLAALIGLGQLKINTGKLDDFLLVMAVTSSLWAMAGVFFIYATFSERIPIISSATEKFIHTNKVWSHHEFDNAFFNLLETHNGIVSSMEVQTSGSQKIVLAQGKDCFRFFLKKFQDKVSEHSKYTIDNVLTSYNSFYVKYGTHLAPYFDNFLNLIAFIDEAGIKEENRKRYCNFVRSQLSGNELIFLFYHGLTKKGDAIKPLMEKYSLLKNVDKNLLFGKESEGEYRKEAYV